VLINGINLLACVHGCCDVYVAYWSLKCRINGFTAKFKSATDISKKILADFET